MILGFYAGKSHNLIGLGIFHGDRDFFDLHENSLNLSNYEIFPHKSLKFRTFKKSSILIVIMEPGIYSKELIPLAYVAWRAGTTTLFLLAPIDCLKIPALDPVHVLSARDRQGGGERIRRSTIGEAY